MDQPDPALDLLFTPAFRAFFATQRDADLSRLLLGRAPPGIDLRLVAEQLKAQRKARDKVPAWAARDDLVYPPPLSVEQASSALTAGWKATLVAGEHLIDLSSGMGVDALTLAPRFRRVTCIEQNPHIARCLRHNAAMLFPHSPPSIDVLATSAEAFAATLVSRDRLAGIAPADTTVHVDPARRDDVERRVFRFSDCSPDVTTLLPQLAGRVGQVLVKASPMIDLTEAMRQLPGVRACHVVSVANECREVLFLVDFVDRPNPEIVCVDLHPARTPVEFRFELAAESEAAVEWSAPGRYLYDANVAIRKAGAFRSVAAAFGLAKLAPSTHLYTSDALVADFPGRIFEVLGKAGKRPHRELPDGRASVIVRNHPQTADQLRARYRLKEGGDHFLIGFRDLDNQARLVIARRLHA